MLLVALCGMLTLTGCMMIEEEFPTLPEEEQEFPVKEDWESVTFKTLTGSEDLIVTRDTENENAIHIQNPFYDQDYFVVALLKSDCVKSQEMAPYLNEISTRITKMHGVNYIPVFLDIYEDSANQSVDWITNLANMESFMNAATACSDNACQEVFLPKFAETLSGNVYFVNKNDIRKTKKGYAWNTTDEPKEQAKKLEFALAEFLDLEEILFDPSVNPWN